MNISRVPTTLAIAVPAAAIAILLSGCMVGPDYKAPPHATAFLLPGCWGAPDSRPPPHAPVADAYRDQDPEAVKHDTADLANWWTVLNDPTLNVLVETAYKQSPTLQTAAVRVLEAR